MGFYVYYIFSQDTTMDLQWYFRVVFYISLHIYIILCGMSTVYMILQEFYFCIYDCYALDCDIPKVLKWYLLYY